MPLARVACGELEHLRLAAVTVDERDLAKAAAMERVGHLEQRGGQRLRRERDGAGIVDMFVRLAVAERREHVARHLGGQTRHRAAQHAAGEHRIHRDRQMRPVLLDCRDRLHDHGVRLVGQRGDLCRRQIGQEAARGKPAVQHQRVRTARSCSSRVSGTPARINAANASSGTMVVRQ